MSHYNGTNYGGRMGTLDARQPDIQAPQRYDNMQHAVAAVDPLVLRRMLLISGTAGHAARAKKDRRA
jgi:hypothetical protein